MRTKYEKQLGQLNQEMIQMGCLIEKAIEGAVNALVNQDTELARKVIEDDEEVNEHEHNIETLCMKLLLFQQPVATDMRNVSAALKMVTDMERIGDQAADIAEISLLLAGQSYIKSPDHLQQMARATIDMVIQSMEAYVERDLEAAQNVIDRDDEVDALFQDMKNDLVDLIAQDRSCGEQAADLLLIAKYFERIGDHATNIAEWVIYSITGEHIVQN